MVDFSKRLAAKKIIKDIEPIKIYDSLDRRSIAGPLRPTQRLLLEKWFNERKNDKNLIIKLYQTQ